VTCFPLQKSTSSHKAKRKAVWFNGDDEGIGSVGAGN
jgi:hypothetical protein